MGHDAVTSRPRIGDSGWFFVAALAAAAAINFILWAGGATWMRISAGGAQPMEEHLPVMPASRMDADQKLRPGDDDSTVSSAAWISYDSFQKLLSEHQVVNQAAYQEKQKPVPGAPPRLDPTPPAPRIRLAAKRSGAVASPVDVTLPSAAQPAAMQPGVSLPLMSPAGFSMQPSRSRHARRAAAGASGTKPIAASATQPAAGRPTSAALSNRESSLAAFVRTPHQAQPGKVVAGPGIKILTAEPGFSAVTLASSVPRDMRVSITFNKQGKAIDAKVIRSSTFPNVDAAVLESLYRWRATGRRLKAVGRDFTMKFTLTWR